MLFDRWCGSKSNNDKQLRYLGHGWTFYDCEESTAIDKEVHRRFFQVFILFGSTELYQKNCLRQILTCQSTARPGFLVAMVLATVPTSLPNGVSIT